MNPLVRRQLAAWSRRYRSAAAALAVLAGLVVAFPSVAPDPDDPVRPQPVGEVAAPSSSMPVPSPPTFAGPLAVSLDPGSGPTLTVPGGGLDAIAPPPPDPGLVATPCPIDLGEATVEPLPLADVLNLASPALPLLGPFVPFAVTGLPVVGPILPVVTPLLPLGEPVFVTFGPLLAEVAGPLAGYEALLLQPITEPLAQSTPAMLDAEREFIAQLQPLLEQVEATGAVGCAVVLTASVAGLVAEVQQSLGLDQLVQRLQEILGDLL